MIIGMPRAWLCESPRFLPCSAMALSAAWVLRELQMAWRGSGSSSAAGQDRDDRRGSTGVPQKDRALAAIGSKQVVVCDVALSFWHWKDTRLHFTRNERGKTDLVPPPRGPA